jgi:hypothetical protein
MLRALLARFFEQFSRALEPGGDVRQRCLRTGTLRVQEHPEGFGKDDLVFKNGALDFVHHLHRQERTAQQAASGSPKVTFASVTIPPVPLRPGYQVTLARNPREAMQKKVTSTYSGARASAYRPLPPSPYAIDATI